MSNPVSPLKIEPSEEDAPLSSAEADVAGPARASALIDEDAGWLPADPERRSAFLQMFRLWHAQILPQHAARGTPAFLYLLAALPILITARDAHPAWKKYCEFLPRAQQACAEIKVYRTVSLVSGLDDLLARVTSAEKTYRQG